MKQILTLVKYISLLAFLLFLTGQAKSQTTLKQVNFDAPIGALSSGWVASPTANGWIADTVTSNRSTGYSGASGLQNIVIKNASGVSGAFALISESISTAGFTGISVLWGARNTTHFADSGSTISSFEWSSDGGNNWNALTYLQNAGNSTWSLVNGGTRIQLPSSADGQSAIVFRWMANLHGNPSGTYRIDDFSVTGTGTSGILEELTKNKPTHLILFERDGNRLEVKTTFIEDEEITFELFDILGKVHLMEKSKNKTTCFYLESIPSGIYFVRASSGSTFSSAKIIHRR